jgi:hypothetical protein
MNMNKNIRTGLFIVVLAFSISGQQNVLAQNEFALRIRVKVSATCCKRCNRKPIQTVYFGLNDPNRTKIKDIITSYSYQDVWKHITVKIDPNVDYALHWFDPTGPGWQKEVLDKKVNIIQEINYHHNDGKLWWHAVWMDATIETYDPVEITDVRYSPCINTGCDGSTQCIDDVNGNLVFTLDVSNTNGPDGVYIRALDKNSNLLGQYYCGSFNTTETIPFSSLNLDDYFGEDIYFQTKTDYGGGVPYVWLYDITSASKQFFKRMPAPTGPVTAVRKACYPEIIVKVPLAASVINDIDSYKFRAIQGDGRDDKTSNVVRLIRYGSVTNNVVSLVPYIFDKNIIINNSGDHTIQIFQSIQDEGKKIPFPNIQCAVQRPFHLPKPKEAVHITSANPLTKGNSEYHTSRHNTLDAKINISVNDWSRVSVVELDYECNFSGSCHYYCTTCNDMEDITNSLVNVNSTTKSFQNIFKDTEFSFRVKDEDGCNSNIVSTTINQPPPFVFNQPSGAAITNVTCHAKNNLVDPSETPYNKHNDGEIVLTYSGGIPEYNISVDGEIKFSNVDVTNLTVSGLSFGDHTIRVFNDYGDGISRNVRVGHNDEITVLPSFEPIKCFNGQTDINLQVNNNNSSTTNYHLFKNGVLDESLHSNTFYSKESGDYLIKFDNNQCIAENAFQITQPNDIIINPTTTVVARYGDHTGAIHLDITEGTGGYQFEVSNGTSVIEDGSTSRYADIENLPAGYYNVGVTDANGCPKSSGSIHVRQPQSPLEITFTKKDVDCHGNATGEIYPKATGGWKPYRFGLNGKTYGNVASIENIPATIGEFDSVFVIDSAGISDTAFAKITQFDELITSVNKVHDLKCFEDNSGAVLFNITGGTGVYNVSPDSINWVPGDSISGLAANTSKRIFISDENNCISVENVEITQPEKLEVVTDSVTDAFCNHRNGAIQTSTIGGTEGYAFHWINLDTDNKLENNSDLLRNVPSGQYKLIVEDNNNCKDSLTALISDTDGPQLQSYYIEPVTCNGEQDGKIVIQRVTGGYPDYEYYIDGIKQYNSISGLSEGTYHFRLLDSMGCKVDRYFTVTQPDTISIKAEINSPTCHNSTDGTLTASALGGNGNFKWDWSNRSTSPRLWRISAGNYQVTVTDKKGCTKSQAFEVTAPEMPTANLGGLANILCTGNTLTLDGGDYRSHKWYRNDRTISTARYLDVSESGTYIVRILDEKGCVGKDTLELTVSDSPLDATLLVQDSANISEIVEAIDVTWPVPDSIQWFFDSVVDTYEFNEWSQQFSASNTGVINVKLRAWYGGCYSDASKTITIYNNGEIKQAEPYVNQPLIEGFIAYPNPNRGDFYIEAKLSRVADIKLQIFNTSSGSIINIQEYQGLEDYTIPYNFSLLNSGIYVIILSAENEVQQMKVVIE